MLTRCTFKDFGHNSNQTRKHSDVPANYSRPFSSWMEWVGLGLCVEIFRKNKSWKHNDLVRCSWSYCIIFCLGMAWKRYFGICSTLQLKIRKREDSRNELDFKGAYYIICSLIDAEI